MFSISKVSENNNFQHLQLALALQCFHNEYIFNQTEDENRTLEKVIKTVEISFEKGTHPSLKSILCIASYRALYTFKWSNLLDLPLYYKELIKRQILDFRNEKNIKSKIKKVGVISDKISGGVSAWRREVFSKVKDLNFMSGNWFLFDNQKVYITRSGYTGEDGFEISVPNNFADKLTRELIDKGSKLVGLGARDTLRLEAGLCLYGHDLDKDKTPVEANLKWAISKERISKGDFIGSDIIIKQLNDGVTKIRVGIKPEGRIIAREKTKIFNQSDVHIGEITSGTFGPSVNGCLLYTSPSPRDRTRSRMPSSA